MHVQVKLHAACTCQKSYKRRKKHSLGITVIIHLFGNRFWELGELIRVNGELPWPSLISAMKLICPSQFKRVGHPDLSYELQHFSIFIIFAGNRGHPGIKNWGRVSPSEIGQRIVYCAEALSTTGYYRKTWALSSYEKRDYLGKPIMHKGNDLYTVTYLLYE